MKMQKLSQIKLGKTQGVLQKRTEGTKIIRTVVGVRFGCLTQINTRASRPRSGRDARLIGSRWQNLKSQIKKDQ